MSRAELPSTSDPALALARRLRRMRWFATGLLALMAVLFLATSWLLPRYPLVGAVRAFAEAALIGGLADWFAVTALFRRPLGLPIPHTAIVPSRKDEIGRALARFIRDHFLVRDAVERRLRRADLAGRLGGWLEQERNAALVGRDFAAALDWLVSESDGGELRGALAASVRAAFTQLPVGSGLATLIEVLASGPHADALIDQLVQVGRGQLESHRVDIRVRIHERSPWWLPKFVDQEIYDQLIGEIERILHDIGADPTHPARADLKARLKSFGQSLAVDPQLIEKSRALQEQIIDHPAVRGYARDLWRELRGSLHAALATAESPLRLGVQREIRNIGAALRHDTAVAARLNGWLEQVLLYLVDNYRDPLSEIVSETIERWDPAATADRIELNIGRDLQFIRVNGTLVGGLVGVLLYFGWQAVT